MGRFTSASLAVLFHAAATVRADTFQGRYYAKAVPPAPTGLLVALLADGSPLCSTNVNANPVVMATGAAVVCPRATSSGGEGCWKALGYCGGDDSDDNMEDVDFLADLIAFLVAEHSIPEDKVIISGYSNGGSMAYKYYCNKSATIGGVVIAGQAYFDPAYGLPNKSGQYEGGPNTCTPEIVRPLYSAVGAADPYYGSGTGQYLEAVGKFKIYSKTVAGCTGARSTVPAAAEIDLPGYSAGAVTCYEFGGCPVETSVHCRVAAMGHDQIIAEITAHAFPLFFGPAAPSPVAAPSSNTPSPVKSPVKKPTKPTDPKKKCSKFKGKKKCLTVKTCFFYNIKNKDKVFKGCADAPSKKECKKYSKKTNTKVCTKKGCRW
eukprot:CAMPEP_0194283566 /NCGR_PEP_ID=MMETSP0169-20130528/25677_1 /TAXON_ID=218684 /ORGANISM="Corethron pennatum, Strain L29A3" /LENGTH=375 /DNA_ID=CAMNT_0039029191 /DNA_START=77 /DNA_END=1201 /DNA_ORIENTATION=-